MISTHHRFLFGTDTFKLGPSVGYELIGPEVTDLTPGFAFRFGKVVFFEVRGGYYERHFHQQAQNLTGTGYFANLAIGGFLNDFLGFDLSLSYKRIQGGMDARTMIDLLPYLDLKVGF